MKDIELPSYSKDRKKFEQNNKSIALNIVFVPYNTNQIRQGYISKYNIERDIQLILLMITNDDENWDYIAIKCLSRLLRGITSNDNGHFYCLIFFHSYRTKKTLKKHEKVCKDLEYCYVKIPKEDKKY